MELDVSLTTRESDVGTSGSATSSGPAVFATTRPPVADQLPTPRYHYDSHTAAQNVPRAVPGAVAASEGNARW